MCVRVCLRACSRNNARTRTRCTMVGGVSLRQRRERVRRLIVFLRINIINVIQQSVLDEGAITPGKIHSTFLIGATIDLAHGRSALRFRFRGTCSRVFPTSEFFEARTFARRGYHSTRIRGPFSTWHFFFFLLICPRSLFDRHVNHSNNAHTCTYFITSYSNTCRGV